MTKDDELKSQYNLLFRGGLIVITNEAANSAANQWPPPPPQPTERGDVLDEAKSLITGDRNVTYGSPTENFHNIAEFWTTRLSHKLKEGESISGFDVADLMALLKIARNVVSPKRDNAVDGAGYLACGWETHLAESEGLEDK